MMASSINEKTAERRKQVMVGELPEDFLRLTKSPSQQQISADEQAAMLLQQQLSSSFHPQNSIGRLQITVVEARLTKNYGMTRMDPYVRLRVGHMIYETNTDPNGAKNPKWNRTISCYLPQGVNTISLEVFDERAFTMDEKVAWTQVQISDRVLTHNETEDQWYPLNGRQGDEKEGNLNLVLSFSPMSAQMSPVYSPQYYMMPAPVYGGAAAVPVYHGGVPQVPVAYPSQPMQPRSAVQQPRPQPISEEDIKQVSEMFPNVETQVVKSVMEANNGNKDATINSLLSMST